MSSTRVTIPLEEALARLAVIEDYDPGDGPKPCVHTFRGGSALLGAHWSVEEARAAMEKHGVEESGPFMQAMGHGLATMDDTGPVFFETQASGPVEGRED